MTNTSPHINAISSWNQQVSRKYPWITLFVIAVLGGFLGYLIGFLIPAIYEAKAVLTTNIDLKENRPIITEIMVDSQLNYVGELMFNSKIIDLLLLQEASLGNPLTVEDLKSMATIERQLMSTIIKVRGKDPVIAARIASNWASIAYETLLEAKSHVLTIDDAKQQLAFIKTCFPSSPDEGNNEPNSATEEAFCEGFTYQSVEVKLEDLTKVLAEEESKTLGLTAYININQFIPASIPTIPTSTNQGLLALSGMVIGIVVGIVYFDLRRVNKIDEN